MQAVTSLRVLPTLWGPMPTAKELFLDHVNGRSSDTSVTELRRTLTLAKMDALGEAHGVGATQLREIVPPLYEKIVGNADFIGVKMMIPSVKDLEVLSCINRYLLTLEQASPPLQNAADCLTTAES